MHILAAAALGSGALKHNCAMGEQLLSKILLLSELWNCETTSHFQNAWAQCGSVWNSEWNENWEYVLEQVLGDSRLECGQLKAGGHKHIVLYSMSSRTLVYVIMPCLDALEWKGAGWLERFMKTFNIQEGFPFQAFESVTFHSHCQNKN